MNLIAWLNQYGYIVLFTALMLELIAFPLPGEVLMTYVGFLVFKGHLSWFYSIGVATAGACTGITFSYLIGFKLGSPFFNRYGRYIHMGPERLEKASYWFQRYGKRMLVLAYFIPGVRHITGYFSGVTKVTFRKFAVFAYLGAFCWTATFISLGKTVGPKWETFHSTIKKYLIVASMVIAIILVAIYLFRNYKSYILENLLITLNKGIMTFHSLGRVKVFVAITAAVFWGLIILMFGLIQDYLGNEFGQFDRVVIILIHLVFSNRWSSWMNLFNLFASAKVFTVVILFTFMWVLAKGKNRSLEIKFFLIVIAGGLGLDVGLRNLFHRVGPTQMNNLVYTFPSGQVLLSLVTYGFTSFLLFRHSNSTWIRIAAFVTTLTISLLIGLSRVFLNLQFPSDVVSGYVFGGVWLSLNIILLEVFRVLNTFKFGS